VRRLGRRAKVHPHAGDNPRSAIDQGEALRLWALNLPFVRERLLRDGQDSLREFTVDCPYLKVQRVWLLLRGAGSEHVVAFVTHEDGEVSCISFDRQRTACDPRHIEAGLLLSYESTFLSRAA
jgi:hypothetical protein